MAEIVDHELCDWPSDLLVCLCGIFQLQAGDERVSPRAFINRIPNEPTIAIGGALAFGQAGFAAFIGILIFDGIDVELKAADVDRAGCETV